MLSKFSVKKPLTIFVSVLSILLLGFISFSKMSTDLLPSMDLPYVAVITTYPGASPEKIEQTVTKPLEKTLSTTGGMKEITSISSENSSMIIVEFVQGTNMDGAMIELNGKVDLVKGQLDDAVSAPILMKINPDLLPVMIASVDMDGKDAIETSRLVEDKILPELERVEGVASVDAMGLVEKQLKITLDQEKIDRLNDRILESVDQKLLETKLQLEEGERQLKQARKTFEQQSKSQTDKLAQSSTDLQNGKMQIQQGISTLNNLLTDTQSQRTELVTLKTLVENIQAGVQDMSAEVLKQITDVLTRLQEEGILQGDMVQALLTALQQPGNNQSSDLQQLLTMLETGIQEADKGIEQINSQKSMLEEELSKLSDAETQLEAGKMTLTQQLAMAGQELSSKEEEFAKGKAEFEEAEKQAYQQVGLEDKITQQTISQILAAENFSMPAGYLSGEGEEYSVKVGEPFSSVEELETLEIFQLDVDNIGKITLSDLADITFTDNAGEMYAKINGNDGILLTFQKQSTASTSEVSKDIRKTMETLEAENPGMHMTALNDQGIYIDIVINSVIENLLLGGLLAIVILFLFLRSGKPTFIIATSIPISLLFAIVLMYFSGVNLNIISLAGLALGVGMLVDNSIVVIENIYRLRSEGMSVLQASVQGASQVAGAIAASTLTTICVFLPIVFTKGLSRELFADMGLTIAFSLIASLIIALTLVPALSSKVLKKPDQVKHRFFEKFANGYEKLLSLTLKHKAPVMLLVIVLLGLSVVGAVSTGTAFMPETDSSQISVSMEMPKDSTTEEIRDMSDQVMKIIQEIPGVVSVGAMQGGGMSMMGGGSNGVSMYVILSEERDDSSTEIAQKISDNTESLPCEVTATSSSGDMSAMGGSGIQVDIRGNDVDRLREIARDVTGILEDIEGTQDIAGVEEETNTETKVTVDKNKALRYGLTVAQVYQEVASVLSTETTATTVTFEEIDYPVVVAKDADEAMTMEALRNHTLKVTEQGEEKEILLSDIAEITEQKGLSSIRHENQMRYLSVTASVDADHNIGLIGRELQTRLNQYEVPAGYSVEIAGENEMINDMLGDLITMVLLAIVLIYFIMVAQFQSLLSPFIVMFTIPLAFTGGLLALWIFGFEISVVAMLGFLVLAGIVVNNGIVFVDYVNQLRAEGMEKREALLNAGKTRIRPILMTALTTILGLSTLAFGMGMGADMLQPLAVVTIGGLSYATLLTLFVVPIMYDIFHKKSRKTSEPEEGESVGE